MFEFVASHIPESLVALGLVLLAIEVAVLGFSTFILFFLGISLVLTGSAIWLGMLPDTWASIILANAILTSILSFVLWQPLKKMQGQTDDKLVTSDFVGVRFCVDSDVSSQVPAQHKYSGIMWQVKSAEVIPAGTEVEIIRAEVGVLWVKVAT